MSTLPLIYVPDAVLKETATAIENIDTAIQKQAEDMLETMYEEKGIGLAANQVNKLNRMLVMDVPVGCWEYAGEDRGGVLLIGAADTKEEPKANPLQMINPRIVKQSEQRSVYQEGCLSVPGQFANIERPAVVTVEWLTPTGKKRVEEFAGLDSHCVQHEIDHLDGVLFLDYLSKLKRSTMIRKVEKMRKGITAL